MTNNKTLIISLFGSNIFVRTFPSQYLQWGNKFVCVIGTVNGLNTLESLVSMYG